MNWKNNAVNAIRFHRYTCKNNDVSVYRNMHFVFEKKLAYFAAVLCFVFPQRNCIDDRATALVSTSKIATCYCKQP